MGVRVFSSSIIRHGLGEPELQALVAAFRAYKDTGDPKDVFGRDATFDRPPSISAAGLQHVHLNEGRPWGVRVLQFGRKSDLHLVYCQGYFRTDCYLLITVVKGAHAKYRDDLYMLSLADIAAAFRDKY